MGLASGSVEEAGTASVEEAGKKACAFEMAPGEGKATLETDVTLDGEVGDIGDVGRVRELVVSERGEGLTSPRLLVVVLAAVVEGVRSTDNASLTWLSESLPGWEEALERIGCWDTGGREVVLAILGGLDTCKAPALWRCVENLGGGWVVLVAMPTGCGIVDDLPMDSGCFGDSDDWRICDDGCDWLKVVNEELCDWLKLCVEAGFKPPVDWISELPDLPRLPLSCTLLGTEV